MLLLTGHSKAGDVLFVKNQGQWEKDVLYRGEIPGGFFYLNRGGLTYFFIDNNALEIGEHHPKDKPEFVNGHVVKVHFKNCNLNSTINEDSQIVTKYNYLLGNDSKKWTSNVPAFRKLLIRDVWDGIDMEIVSKGDFMKFNYIVNPGADLKDIKLTYEGAKGLSIEDGKLWVYTTLNSILEEKPEAWISRSFKENRTIKCQYVLKENEVSYQVKNYNNKEKLIIDPTLIFSTFSGSIIDNWGFTATYDSLGHGYSGGTVYGVGFPVTSGAIQIKWAGGTDGSNAEDIARDCGILKYSSDGTQLLWCTYLGGSENEQPHSMIVNSLDQLIVMGTTFSYNFPVGSNAFDKTYNGSGDMFIAIISSDGTSLIGGTYLGGSNRDGLNGTKPNTDPTGPLAHNYGDQFRGEVIVDASDNIFVASCTQSSDFPVKNGKSLSISGPQDGCVYKVNKDASALVWSTFLGGTKEDAAYGINLDSKGNVFVCGGTESTDFPTTSGAVATSSHGGIDGFISKLSSDGKSLLASTYLGTNKYDQSYLLQIDAYDRVYVTGQSLGAMPVTSNVYSNTGGTQFISMYNNLLSNLDASTVFGSGRNTSDLSPSAFLVDVCGRVYFSGWGGKVNNLYDDLKSSTNGLPITNDAFQKTTDGSDFYLIILDKAMSSLIYGSYFGGAKSPEHVDGGTSRFDKHGIVYQAVCAGCGGFSDFPTTVDAWSRLNKGKTPNFPYTVNCNNAIFKLDLSSSMYPPLINDTTILITALDELNYTFTIKDLDPLDSIFFSYKGDIFGSGKINPPYAIMTKDSGKNQITGRIYWKTNCNHSKADTFTVVIIARDNGCPVARSSTITLKIFVQAPPTPVPPAVFCLERMDNHTLGLTWEDIVTDVYFDHFVLMKKHPDGTFEKLTEFKKSDLSKTFIDYYAPNHLTTDYRYFIYGINVCGRIGDTSRVLSSIPDKDSIPKPVYMYTSTVDSNKVVRVVWNRYIKDDFYFYIMYRREGTSGLYTLYKMIKKQLDTVFIDSNVNVQKYNYSYKLMVKGQCGLYGPFGNIGQTILLSGNASPFVNQLSFSKYIDWAGGVKRYEIYRSEGDSVKNWKLIDTVDKNTTTYTDNNLNLNEGIYYYRIKAYQEDTILNANSLSNEIRLVQKPYLYVPDAFTPNDDGINDTMLTVPVFVKDYHLKIFNSWGEMLWETYDKHVFWNGTWKGVTPFNNCFIWQAEFSGYDKSRYYLKGNISILP